MYLPKSATSNYKKKIGRVELTDRFHEARCLKLVRVVWASRGGNARRT